MRRHAASCGAAQIALMGRAAPLNAAAVETAATAVKAGARTAAKTEAMAGRRRQHKYRSGGQTGGTCHGSGREPALIHNSQSTSGC
ncbi:hypothetical protein PCA20602_00827 [Pandoraea capi]|uniref:Uncharacterized protein n=1 Tax=Pandoraea capi TaxID=2508286 RepID=A0ABY6VSL5_9BURK|nr:hypothetical protein PCA20602_00827 [Pandoraea capi]